MNKQVYYFIRLKIKFSKYNNVLFQQGSSEFESFNHLINLLEAAINKSFISNKTYFISKLKNIRFTPYESFYDGNTLLSYYSSFNRGRDKVIFLIDEIIDNLELDLIFKN